MKAKEPLVRYDATPSVPVMRGRLIKALENEEDTIFIHAMYVTMNQLKMDSTGSPTRLSQVDKTPKYTLSELRGILASDSIKDLSYDDMRQAYLKERYSL